jgi:hypothetical protein
MSEQAEAIVHGFPARVELTTEGRASRTELLTKLQARNVLDPTIFEEHPPFLWGAQISSTRLDAYYTRMSATTSLKNFADDAETAPGVSFQNSHNSRELGFGRSIAGKFIGAQGNGIAFTRADFYTIPGVQLGSVSTDDLIAGIRSGLVADVSIGFYNARFICNICGRDMARDWACPHIPGFFYNPAAPDDWHTDPEGTMAIATVEDARLAEVSAVYDGATPGATINQIYRAADSGQLPRNVARYLESHYRINLPSARLLIPGGAPTQEEPMAVSLTQGADQAPPADALAPVRAALQTAGVPTEHATDPIAGISWLAQERGRLLPFQTQVAALEGQVRTLQEQIPAAEDVRAAQALRAEVEQLRPFAEEVRALRPLADENKRLTALVAELEPLRTAAADGKTYRDDLLESALKEGRRAYGADFQETLYKGILEREGLPVLKRFREDWKAMADKQFPSGRLSIDALEDEPVAEPEAESPPPPAAGRSRPIPAAAYRD